MATLGYATVGSNDSGRRTFYDALSGTAGIVGQFDHPSGGRIYARRRLLLGVLGPYNKSRPIGTVGMSGSSLTRARKWTFSRQGRSRWAVPTKARQDNRGPNFYFFLFPRPRQAIALRPTALVEGSRLCGKEAVRVEVERRAVIGGVAVGYRGWMRAPAGWHGVYRACWSDGLPPKLDETAEEITNTGREVRGQQLAAKEELPTG